MQHDDANPEAYLASLDDDWRLDLVTALRRVFLDRGLAEGIGYGMLRYEAEDTGAFHLNAQKRHVGLYAGDVAALDPEGRFTSGMDCGKGCLRLKKRDLGALERLEGFIDTALAARRAGIRSDC